MNATRLDSILGQVQALRGVLDLAEREVAAGLASTESEPQLWRLHSRAREIERELRGKELQGPILGVQRRIEARIAQLGARRMSGRAS